MKNNIDALLEKFPYNQRDSLLPLLQELQNELGYLTEEAIIKLGAYLNMPTSKIYGVATFYDQFRFEPQGKYHIRVCRGTACHVLGSATVLEQLEQILQIKAGQTTRDGLFSLDVSGCIGACGQAPVLAINGDFHTHIQQRDLKALIESYKTLAKQEV